MYSTNNLCHVHLMAPFFRIIIPTPSNELLRCGPVGRLPNRYYRISAYLGPLLSSVTMLMPEIQGVTVCTICLYKPNNYVFVSKVKSPPLVEGTLNTAGRLGHLGADGNLLPSPALFAGWCAPAWGFEYSGVPYLYYSRLPSPILGRSTRPVAGI